MKWEKVKLGDIATFSNGINFNKTAYAKGIKLIGVSNFGDRFYPDYSQLQEVKKDIVRLEDCLRNGDIVFVRSNGNKELVGRCMLVKNPTERVTYSGFCIRARLNDTDRYDPVYFTYYFKSKAFRRAVSGTAVGANIQNLSQARLSNHECRIPSIEVQHRIADILSVYDDLIENNQKQIKLLEEAAQRLYKEWFVDLHFPGHENTKIVDGVPEGWQWCKVRDVADINSSTLPKNYKEDFIDYVDLGSVRCGHIETRTRYNLNEAPGRAKRCAKDGDIIWGMVRPNLKAYALVTNPKETDVFSTGFAVLSAKKVPYSYLYCAVTQEEFVGYLVNATNGAAYPAVKPVHFEVADILKPDDKVLEQFHSVADSIYRKKEALENQNHNLRESRDLILPKLMSGEVEV